MIAPTDLLAGTEQDAAVGSHEHSELAEPAHQQDGNEDLKDLPPVADALSLDMAVVSDAQGTVDSYKSAADPSKEKTCICYCDEESVSLSCRDSPSVVGMAIERVVSAAFKSILEDTHNRICIDCEANNPDWVSIGFGTLLCLSCAGRHRSFGTHVTLVRSITMDDWSDDQLNYIRFGGNKAFELYLASECGDETIARNKIERYYHPKINYYREVLNAKVQERVAKPYDAETWSEESPIKPVMNLHEKAVVWTPDEDSPSCMICEKEFTFFFRRHHCRRCGRCVCGNCAPAENTRPIYEFGLRQPARHCFKCYKSPSVDWTALSSTFNSSI